MRKGFPATIIVMGLAVIMVCPAEEWKTSGRKQPTKCTAVSEKLGGLHEELAADRLRTIHEQLVELSEKYPETSGGKEANEMLAKAGLKNPGINVFGNYGIRPKNSFASGVPAFHNSYRP